MTGSCLTLHKPVCSCPSWQAQGWVQCLAHLGTKNIPVEEMEILFLCFLKRQRRNNIDIFYHFTNRKTKVRNFHSSKPDQSGVQARGEPMWPALFLPKVRRQKSRAASSHSDIRGHHTPAIRMSQLSSGPEHEASRAASTLDPPSSPRGAWWLTQIRPRALADAARSRVTKAPITGAEDFRAQRLLTARWARL